MARPPGRRTRQASSRTPALSKTQQRTRDRITRSWLRSGTEGIPEAEDSKNRTLRSSRKRFRARWRTLGSGSTRRSRPPSPSSAKMAGAKYPTPVPRSRTFMPARISHLCTSREAGASHRRRGLSSVLPGHRRSLGGFPLPPSVPFGGSIPFLQASIRSPRIRLDEPGSDPTGPGGGRSSSPPPDPLGKTLLGRALPQALGSPALGGPGPGGWTPRQAAAAGRGCPRTKSSLGAPESRREARTIRGVGVWGGGPWAYVAIGRRACPSRPPEGRGGPDPSRRGRGGQSGERSGWGEPKQGKVQCPAARTSTDPGRTVRS